MAGIIVIHHTWHACDKTVWFHGCFPTDWDRRVWDARDALADVEVMLANGHTFDNLESLERLRRDAQWLEENYPRRKRK